MWKNKKVSVVFSTYNEKDSIRWFIDGLFKKHSHLILILFLGLLVLDELKHKYYFLIFLKLG